MEKPAHLTHPSTKYEPPYNSPQFNERIVDIQMKLLISEDNFLLIRSRKEANETQSKTQDLPSRYNLVVTIAELEATYWGDISVNSRPRIILND